METSLVMMVPGPRGDRRFSVEALETKARKAAVLDGSRPLAEMLHEIDLAQMRRKRETTDHAQSRLEEIEDLAQSRRLADRAGTERAEVQMAAVPAGTGFAGSVSTDATTGHIYNRSAMVHTEFAGISSSVGMAAAGSVHQEQLQGSQQYQQALGQQQLQGSQQYQQTPGRQQGSSGWRIPAETVQAVVNPSGWRIPTGTVQPVDNVTGRIDSRQVDGVLWDMLNATGSSEKLCKAPQHHTAQHTAWQHTGATPTRMSVSELSTIVSSSSAHRMNVSHRPTEASNSYGQGQMQGQMQGQGQMQEQGQSRVDTQHCWQADGTPLVRARRLPCRSLGGEVVNMEQRAAAHGLQQRSFSTTSAHQPQQQLTCDSFAISRHAQSEP